MNYTIEKPTETTAIINIPVSKEEMEQAMETAKAATGSDDIQTNRKYAISLLASQALDQAVPAEGLKLASQPTLEAEETPEGGCSIKLVCDLLPAVELPAYTGLDIVRPEVTITDDEVTARIEADFQQNKIFEDVPEGTPAKEGDEVILNFLGEKDGIPFPGGEGHDYPLVLGSHTFIPGFEEQLIGIKAGEERNVDVTFPENYPAPELAGQPVVFYCKALAVKQEVKPELSDDFIGRVEWNGVKTVEQLKEKISGELKEAKEQEADNKALSEALDKIVSGAKVDIPEKMIQTQLEQHMQQYQQQMQQFGMSLDQFLQMSDQTLEDFRNNLIPEVEREIKTALVMEAIADKEEIEVSDEELEAEYELLSKVYNYPADMLKQMLPAGSIHMQVRQQKTADFLKENNLKK